jgi:large subunit ribosomal protein L21
MYAVIKTGGKQYTVRPGDVLIVEKLAGEPGADVTFGEVLMLGDGDNITIGAPAVAGASVLGTLIETRKGDKIKIFKKNRRQGYRRTNGHRQQESVIRVTSVAGSDKTDKWDGTVDLTPRALINARARGLKNLILELEGASLMTAPEAKAAKPAKKAAAPKTEAPKTEAKVEAAPAAEAPAKAAPAKKAAAPKAAAAKPAADKAPAKKAAPKKTDT